MVCTVCGEPAKPCPRCRLNFCDVHYRIHWKDAHWRPRPELDVAGDRHDFYQKLEDDNYGLA